MKLADCDRNISSSQNLHTFKVIDFAPAGTE
jgi:hypothetical protein